MTMKLRHMNRKTALCTVAALIPVSVWASSGSQELGERRRPPREAFEACKDKSEGASVVVTTPRGETIKAMCTSFDGQLVAVPEGPPPVPRERGGKEGNDN